MNVEDLSRFVAIASGASMNEVAAALYTTEPTLSRSIARLEQQLGVALFDRQNNRLQLNDAGRIFLTHANRMLRELDVVKGRLRDLGDPEFGSIRVAFSSSLGPWVVHEIIARYRNTSLAGPFALLEGSPTMTNDLLERNQADIAFNTRRPSSSHLEWRPIRRERMYLLVPSNHILAGTEEVDLRQVAGEQFILSNEPQLRELGLLLCANADFSPRVTSECNDVSVIRELVAMGLGIAIVTRSHIHSEPAGLRYLRINDPMAFREIGIAHNPLEIRSPAAEAFLKFALEIPKGKLS